MLKKRKHKFMAFLLSAMMLITGTAMGAAPAAAAEKSPPALKSCSANFGYDFVLSFDTSTDAEWMSKITSVTVTGESCDKRKHISQRLEQQKLLCKFRQALHR